MSEDDITFPREPWRRLLESGADGPPETTDARIRAAARRDLAPRGPRWWLPASLAASFVLAVFVVQSQFGTLRVPVATESDAGAGGAMNARIIEREEAKEMREPGAAPAAAPKRRAPAPEEPELEEVYGYSDAELAADSAGAGPRIGGPEHDLKVATELPEDAFAAAPPPAAEAPTSALSDVVQARQERQRVRTPEDWYAEIERLRAAGQDDEAERELEKLRQAFPGWLERHLAKQPER